ncbi:hypothetical protein HPG69_016528, partial [Diceros bicornis minor]
DSVEQGLRALQGLAGQPVTPSGPRKYRQLAWCSSQLPTMARGLPSITSLAHFCQKMNRLKTLEESTRETSLRRCLSMLDLTLLGVGATVGMGLYVLTGAVAKEMAGPAVIVSFGVAAMASLLAALCYAEFKVRVPQTGSPYLFTYLSMGKLWAFLLGWIVLFQCLISGTAECRAWSCSLDAIFSPHIRSFTEAHTGMWQVPFLAQYPDFLAAGITLLVSTFISCGARISSWLNHTFLAISLVIVLFMIILGCVLARPHKWSAEEGGFAPFGFSGIMIAFVGFGYIAASTEEAQNPKRAMPMAITISLALVVGANILVSTGLTLMVPWHSLDLETALTDAFHQLQDLRTLAQVLSFESLGHGQHWYGGLLVQHLPVYDQLQLPEQNNNCLASQVACHRVHCGVLCGTESSPVPGNQMIIPNPQQRC